jgi:hypothetical protein
MFCELWREGEVSDQVYADFCGMDFDAKSEIVDVETLCTVDAAPDWAAEAFATTGFATTLQDWRAEVEETGCGSSESHTFTMWIGVCGDGNRFLERGRGLSGVYNFYDGESGEFVGARFWADLIVPPCCAVWYLPGRIECAGATVTEVLCGERIAEGDAIEFR